MDGDGDGVVMAMVMAKTLRQQWLVPGGRSRLYRQGCMWWRRELRSI